MAKSKPAKRRPKSSPKSKSARSRAEAEAAPDEEAPAPVAKAIGAALLAWLVPGLGHFVLGRRLLAAAFAVLVIGSLVVGWSLDGRLLWQFSGSPLPILGTLGTLGSGLPVLILRLGLGHAGDPLGAGWEYGGVFLLTAGLMNLLLVLDAWDLALGREPSLATAETGGDEASEDADEDDSSEDDSSAVDSSDGDSTKEAS